MVGFGGWGQGWVRECTVGFFGGWGQDSVVGRCTVPRQTKWSRPANAAAHPQLGLEQLGDRVLQLAVGGKLLDGVRLNFLEFAREEEGGGAPCSQSAAASRASSAARPTARQTAVPDSSRSATARSDSRRRHDSHTHPSSRPPLAPDGVPKRPPLRRPPLFAAGEAWKRARGGGGGVLSPAVGSSGVRKGCSSAAAAEMRAEGSRSSIRRSSPAAKGCAASSASCGWSSHGLGRMRGKAVLKKGSSAARGQLSDEPGVPSSEKILKSWPMSESPTKSIVPVIISAKTQPTAHKSMAVV
eukprot:scaffold47486_cov26-Tisochrysis_lutea.AAC.2